MQISQFERNGFFILKKVLDEKTAMSLNASLTNLRNIGAVTRKNKTVYGVRNLLNIIPAIRNFSQSQLVRSIAEKILGEKAKIVRAIYFDKTAEANWKVPWHQDLTIAVREKRETDGFSAWTNKAGIQHVQPPIEILEKMLTLRFHLDAASEANGALKVIPQSHLKGRLSASEIKSLRHLNKSELCIVERGDCLVMRPLLLHSSSAGTIPQNRRVIHFEFSAETLPNRLEWHES